MSISKISGVLWDNITKISGISRSLVKKIGRKNTPVDVTCTEIQLSFGINGKSACGGSAESYYLDESTSTDLSRGTLYTVCGQELAPEGFYAEPLSQNNRPQYWQWDGTSLSLIGICGR